MVEQVIKAAIVLLHVNVGASPQQLQSIPMIYFLIQSDDSAVLCFTSEPAIERRFVCSGPPYLCIRSFGSLECKWPQSLYALGLN
jgi:hypothetical protein